MKTKKIVLCSLLMLAAITSFAQIEKQPGEIAPPVSTRIERNDVPTIIIDSYIKDYPITTSETWHGYPDFRDDSDWYGYDTLLYSKDNPKYYIVEFTKDQKQHKVIYSLAGKKIATHISISSKIQKAIATSIVKSKYRDWKITGEKEEIFKDAEEEKIIVYRIMVQKGSKQRYLFYKPDGTLIKDRKIDNE